MKKKLLTIAIASAFALLPSIVSNADESISIAETFPDEELRYVINEYADKDKDGFLSADEISNFTKFEYTYINNIKSFEGIDKLTALSTLTLMNNTGLRHIDLSYNTKLKNVTLSINTNLEDIEINNIDNLETLTLNRNESLKSLDVSYLTKLTKLEATQNKLNSIKFSDNYCLDNINLSNNSFRTIDLKGATAVKDLNLSNNLLTTFTLNGNKKLEKIDLTCNKNLTDINIDDAVDLESLSVYGTKVEKINIYFNENIQLAADDTDPKFDEGTKSVVYEYSDGVHYFSASIPDTAIFTMTPPPTPTEEPTPTDTVTPTPVEKEPTAAPTEVAEPTAVAEPTTVAEPTKAAEPTTTAEPTKAEEPTITVTATPAPSLTVTATPTPTATVTPTATPTAEPTTEAPVATEDKNEATVAGNTYKVVGKTATVTAAKNGKIPATVKINGKKYKVTVIASNVLTKKTKLPTITIGKNVTKIQKGAFSKATGVKTIVVKSKGLKSIGKNAFGTYEKKVTVKLPSKKATKIKSLMKKSLKGAKVTFK